MPIAADQSLTSVEAQQIIQHLQIAMDRAAQLGATLWQSYRAPFAATQEATLSQVEAQKAWQQVQRARARSVEIVELAIESSWKPFACHSLVVELRNLSLADFNWHKPAFPVASTVSISEGQQIAILTQAAATLDEMGLFLQETAQQLRYVAAERIVSKATNRRIAREVNR